MKLSELQPGDKATVELEVMSINDLSGYINFRLGGWNLTFVVTPDHGGAKIEVTNIVRKPVEPAVGQVWQRNAPYSFEVRIIFVDNVSVVWECAVSDAVATYIKPGHRSINSKQQFKEGWKFVR